MASWEFTYIWCMSNRRKRDAGAPNQPGRKKGEKPKTKCTRWKRAIVILASFSFNFFCWVCWHLDLKISNYFFFPIKLLKYYLRLGFIQRFEHVFPAFMFARLCFIWPVLTNGLCLVRHFSCLFVCLFFSWKFAQLLYSKYEFISSIVVLRIVECPHWPAISKKYYRFRYVSSDSTFSQHTQSQISSMETEHNSHQNNWFDLVYLYNLQTHFVKSKCFEEKCKRLRSPFHN